MALKLRIQREQLYGGPVQRGKRFEYRAYLGSKQVGNADILGRADDCEMKARVLWYITFHPDIFDACSKAWRVS